MGPALRGAAVIQGGQGRPPLQSRTGTAQNGTSYPKGICSAALHCRTPSPTGVMRQVRLSFRRGRCPHRPIGQYEFAGDFRKNGAICRVDVGIDPYNHACRHICIRRKISEKALLPAGQQSLSSPDCLQESPAPTELRRIRTSLQVLNERRFYSRY